MSNAFMPTPLTSNALRSFPLTRLHSGVVGFWRRAVTLATAALLMLGAPASAQLLRDSEIERTLRMLAAPVFNAAGYGGNDIKILFLNDGRLNAFVDGYNNMFFHSGMLQRLETPEQLMAVMAHETGHIRNKDVIRHQAAVERARYTSIITTLVGVAAAAAGGGAGGIGVAAGGQGLAQRQFLEFSREREAAADQAAVEFLNGAGVDPAGMLEVLQTLQREQNIFADTDEYLRSHPLSENRMRALEIEVSRSPARGGKVSDQMRYWHGRMRAKLDGFLGGTSTTKTYGNREFDLYREAIALHRVSNIDGAVAAIDQLISMRPDDPYYWELKGQILRENGRSPRDVEPYRRAAQLAPDDILIGAGLGKALLGLNEPNADREALRVLESLDLLQRGGRAQLFNGELYEWLALAYARNGEDGLSWVATAELRQRTGRGGEAKTFAQRAQTVLPRGSPGWLRAEDILSEPDRN